jgi:hypothetical protein
MRDMTDGDRDRDRDREKERDRQTEIDSVRKIVRERVKKIDTQRER